MAPIPRAEEAGVMQPVPNLVHSAVPGMKELWFKAKQNSRIMRCSSVSSEEGEDSFLSDKTECRRSLVSIYEKKTRMFAFSTSTVQNDRTSTLREGWWGVTPELEGNGPVKPKLKLPLEPEEKKLAVENDDDSSSEISSFEYTLEEKYTWKASQIESKTEKHEFRRKESIKSDGLLIVPYSIEETEHSLEAIEVHKEQIQPKVKVLLPLSDESDVDPEDDLPSSKDDEAEVQVEELDLVVKDENHKEKVIKQKSTLRRHAIRKMKRSIWCITDPEPPPVQQKKKKTYRAVNRRKQRYQRSNVDNTFLPGVEKSVRIMEQPWTRGKKRKIPTSPVKEEPRDSGVHSSGASSSDGNSSGSSGSNSGNYSSGNFTRDGSGTCGNGGAGGSGDDGEKGKKYPWWHLPGGEDSPTPDRDKEEKDEEGQEKMEVDTSVTGFTMFLPSKVDNTEQCHSPGWGEPVTMDTKTAFFPQDIQHASYCSASSCHNIKCQYVKSEVEHFKTHKDCLQCPRCMSTQTIIQQHAQSCCRPGCRVPNCDDLRKKKNGDRGNTGKSVPFVMKKVPAPVPRPEAWIPPRTLYCTPLWDKTRSDGKVIFRNSPFIPWDYFSEHANYNVIRKEELGGGSNGNIYPVYLQSDRSRKVVVKETNYCIRLEEVEVYKLLGDHEHIVKHYGGTFRGSEGHASIFMEKCEMSLFHYMDKVLERRLTVDEAMFFWPQVVSGTNYLHSLPTPVIHKDIKAKNVLLTDEYTRAKLADFDSARRLRDEFTEAGLKPLGTRGFAAPEVLDSEPHGRPADVYSLGCLLVELIVGVPARDNLQQKINKLQELDPDLAQLVQACVRDRPEERPTVLSLLESPVVKRYTRS